MPARRCYLLPTEILRIAFERNWRDWLKRKDCQVVKAENERYTTINLGVPWDLLSSAMKEEMTRDFANKLCLPTPTKKGTQLEFAWLWEA